MNPAMVEKALRVRTVAHRRTGLDSTTARNRARDDLLTCAEAMLSGAERFCVRLLVFGAVKRATEKPNRERCRKRVHS
ncbi:hypothetical protein [Pseudodesulfovibrio tunisiensis]|uniref:hypothetical protein n=1 Tax=Pseudodesulfovibrio tunisiensis TaxID=463192 RepID=UPI001FB34336|nr:hypothetical protein [Pseudodesulfovibrio tunisiensis]